MLMLTLRNLERDGLLHWTERHRDSIAASRVVYDEKVSA